LEAAVSSKWSSFGVSVLLTVLASLTAGAEPAKSSTLKTDGTSEDVTVDKILAQVGKSVVSIQADTGDGGRGGSGFVVGEQGIIAARPWSSLPRSTSGDEPANAAAYLSRAQAWMSKGDVDRAIADLSDAIRLAPESAEIYHHRGLAD
jgi:hypothetical protein